MIDEPKYPKEGPTYPSIESYSVTWTATGDLQTYEDESHQFLIKGYPARIEAEYAVKVPSSNFSWQGKTTTSTFAGLGTEVNGYYYNQGQQPPEDGVIPSDVSLPSGMPETGGGGAARSHK